ncbi:MAG TPA: protease pro-enzyme activation domain-containing protein [Terracidiphilus sp.]
MAASTLVVGNVVPGSMAAGQGAAQAPGTRLQARITAEITNSRQATLPGSLHPFARAENEAGRMPGDSRLNGISIHFNRTAAQQADLNALLAAQQNPSSPQYHQWLTPDQFAARFGMAQADIDKVQSWLEQQGFSIDSVARSRNAIHFSGTVNQVERAFTTEMHYYNVGGVRQFASSTALSVPAAIAPVVESIRDLSSFKPKAMHIKVPAARPSFTSSQTGSVFFAPGDIKTIYDFPATGTGNDGTGQSIAIMGQSSVTLTDIENFESAAGFSKKDPTVVLVPGTGDPVAIAGDQGESSLDLEWSGATAPGADIFFVYTGNSANNNGVFDSISYAVDERIANIISVSYGACEPGLGGFSMESAFQQAAAQGQTIFAASGDQGSTACSAPTSTTVPVATQQELAVNYPASSPFVTAVGGTEIDHSNAAYYTQGQGYWEAQNTSTDEISSALKYIPEIAWNDDTDPNILGVSPSNGGGLSATGGGASSLFTKPSWQAGVTGIPSDSKRDVPDIALFSSPFYVSYLMCTSDTSFWASSQQASCNSGFRDTATGSLTGVGGTSVATPIFAGITALINQQQKYVSGQGQINPMLYALAANSSTYNSAFHDITSGNNYCTAGTNFNYCISSGATEGFKAGTGYDQVTGLGSVDVNNLITAWTANSGTAASLLASTTTVTASNSAPTAGSSVTFTITVASVSGTTTPTGTVNLSIDGSGTSFGSGNTTPVTLSSNGTATYTASFTSTGTHEVVAAYTGDATFATSAGAASVTIATVSSGKGSFTLTPSPSTLTIARGSSGTETIAVAPSGGYTGTVVLNYTTPTALAKLCVFAGTGINSSGDIAVSSASAVSAQLSIDTNASDCSSATGGSKPATQGLLLHRMAAANSPAPKPAPGRLPAEAAFAGLFLIGLVGRYAGRFRSAAWILVLAAAGMVMTACGSSTTTSTTTNPPKGTYTITLTAQDSATSTIKATQSFTLTIN